MRIKILLNLNIYRVIRQISKDILHPKNLKKKNQPLNNLENMINNLYY